MASTPLALDAVQAEALATYLRALDKLTEDHSVVLHAGTVQLPHGTDGSHDYTGPIVHVEWSEARGNAGHVVTRLVDGGWQLVGTDG